MAPFLLEKYYQAFETIKIIHRKPISANYKLNCNMQKLSGGAYMDEVSKFLAEYIAPAVEAKIIAYLNSKDIKSTYVDEFSVHCSLTDTNSVILEDSTDSTFQFVKATDRATLFKYLRILAKENYYLSISPKRYTNSNSLKSIVFSIKF